MRGLALSAIIPLVAAHGFISSPTPRKPGTAFESSCGQQPYSQQSSDINGNVQGILQVVGTDYDTSTCNLWLCKGFKYEDNKDNVQSYTAGQTIDFKINIAAPHTGVANVSVIKTSSNSVIGQPLIEFTNYASNAGMSANNSAFSVTLPSDLGSDCATAGDCVLQWWWDAADINQTYESCVDFTVGGGSGGGSGNSPTPSSPASSVAPTPTTVPTTTAAGAVTQPTTTLPAAANPSDECPDDDEDDDDDSSNSGNTGGDSGSGDDQQCEEDGDDDDNDDDSNSGNTGGDSGSGDDQQCEEDGDDDDQDEGGDDDECEEDEPVQSKRFVWKEWSA